LGDLFFGGADVVEQRGAFVPDRDARLCEFLGRRFDFLRVADHCARNRVIELRVVGRREQPGGRGKDGG